MRWEEWRNFRSLETAKGPRLQLDWSQKEDISLCLNLWIESTDWAASFLIAEVVNGDKGRRPRATNWKCASQSRCKKERILLGHSEKLAVAFGLIDSAKGEMIWITKNLRSCEDWHSLTKFISRYTKREILIQDMNHFHHFKDGVCSYGDYW